MDIGINWGAFPPLADAAGLETAADSLRTHARGFAQIIWDNRDTWKGLGATFESPDAGTLLAVLNPNEPRADDVFTDTNKAADALDEFAATERGLATEKDALHGQYQSLLNEIGDNAEWVKDEDLVKRQQGIVDSMNDIISRHQSAEMTCANAINALYGGTRYVQASADGSVPEGAQAYGMSREQLNSASGAGETPWAKPAEWDKPWYRDVVDGVVDFGSGVWESLKGTVTGLVALVNPFDWETFSATWSGIGTLATDLAVTATPVGAFVSDERRAESGDRLVATAKAVANVEMWKENPAKAAGMLTGDLATVFLPGGAVAKGVTTAAKSGKAVSLAGKAGKFATKFGVPAAKADKFALSTVKGLNSTAMRIDDMSQSVSRLKYEAKLKAMDLVPDRMAAGLTRARASVEPLTVKGIVGAPQSRAVKEASLEEGFTVKAIVDAPQSEAARVQSRVEAGVVSERVPAMAGGGGSAGGGAGVVDSAAGPGGTRSGGGSADVGSGSGGGPGGSGSGGVGDGMPDVPEPRDRPAGQWPDVVEDASKAQRVERIDGYLDSSQTPRGTGVTGADEYTTRMGRGVYERVDPDSTAVTREVELQVRAKWDDASIEDAVRKERYLEQDLVDNGGRKTFVTGTDREITRREVISDYDRAMSLDMPDAVRENILGRQDELASTLRAQGKSEEFIQESLQSQRDVILRDELSKYDLDHKVDLQLGGKDDLDNMNWLRKDVNRSFGSQLKWRSKILGVTDFFDETQGVEFSALSIGRVR
ncbi:hypothetical protein FM125_02480 [Micrococcus lylae]|uniref:Uncharacterized protein n=1 Tax=Micrococcus lylae TaxID=1273 RepID=A0A1R4IIG8_9MICC|nr:HNH endonuclease signature motif containing protein [Micrococcus lylae]SJN19143.1 hypothetical protein FM125_02480 [Micrococcus lylae]